MENLIFPCKSRPPFAIPSIQEETSFGGSSRIVRTRISFTKIHHPVTTKLKPKVTDAHLNDLCKNGRLADAITFLDAIAQSGSKIKPDTYMQLLQCCIDRGSVELGRLLNARVGLLEEMNPFVETKLVSMYAKCGSLGEARKVFEEMRERNLYAWSAIIGAFSREKMWKEVVEHFFFMMEDGVVPDEFLLPKILQASGNCGDAETGELIHSLVIRCGMNFHIRVNNSILAVYAKCGRLSCARRFFENMCCRDRVAWNSIITGYCQKGELEKAHQLFEKMQEEGIEPGLVTWNILINSYSQSGKCDDAMELMKRMESCRIIPDVYTWTSMISGFAQNNRRSQALELFREMLLAGIEPNGVTVTSGISVCASLKALKKGMELHSVAVKVGCVKDLLVGNSLIDMYSKSGELEDARRIFDLILKKDVYTWNSMIAGYCQAGYCGKAYDLFIKMHESDVAPNVVTWNAMISGYLQNGDEDQAMDLFHRMEKDGLIKRDTASWNSLIAGYLQNGNKNKALGIFRQMQSFYIRPNSVTILSILPACANLVAAKKVKEIHGCVLRRNLGSDLSVANCLIDTYAKSGNIFYAQTTFQGILSKDIISWNSLIAGYILHGWSDSALDLFDQMTRMGVSPSRGTFLSIIYGFGLSRMVDEGKRIFSSMIEDHQILPGLEHYSAMIDLLGRSGRLGEAIEFIEDMAIEPDSSIWAALLTASKIHRNIGLAIRAGERLLELEPWNFSIHQQILQMYALAGKFEEVSKLRKTEKRSETKQSLGYSWVEVKNIVHTFVSGDRSRPYSDFLYSWIEKVARKVKAPDQHDRLFIEEEQNDEIGGVHSEKLALAFALIGPSSPSQSVRIVKNQRMCEDCHGTAKFLSVLYGCEIYLSDSKCFHWFNNGHCSCGDYW